MLSKEMEGILNDQMNLEMFSAYLYLAMAADFDSADMHGFSNWMRVQFHEEIAHGMKLYQYIVDKGGRPIISGMETPKQSWNSKIEAFNDALLHEKKVTAHIGEVIDLAISESDHATRSFMNWYIDEQVEEEANVSKIIAELKFLANSQAGMYAMDKELGKRVL